MTVAAGVYLLRLFPISQTHTHTHTHIHIHATFAQRVPYAL